ncbi:pyrophosphatase [Brachybacterium huguangmaarense]
MDLITSFPLGDDIAWTLLAVVLVGIVAIVLGAVLPRRAARDEDAASLDADTGARLGALHASALAGALTVGVPALALLLLVPGSLDVRLLRSGMVLAGIAAGAVAAWRATGILLPSLALDPEDRRTGIARAGSLLVASSLALAVVPIALVVWFLRADAGTPLLAFAGGAAIFALAARTASALAEVPADAAALLAGADENELAQDADDNPGAVHVRTAALFRRGPVRAGELVAAAAAVLGTGIALGIAVLTVEGMIVPLLAGGIAMLTALLVAVVPQFGAAGRERETLRLGSLLPAVLGIGALVATVVVWLPGTFAKLRFAAVGLDSFTDPVLTGSQGGEPVSRADLEPQITQAASQFDQLLTNADESASSRTILDTVAIYGIHPQAVSAIALGIGAVVALLAIAVTAFAADRRGSSALAAARTSRTGGALGALSALRSGGTGAALVLAILAAGLLGLGVTGQGIGMLTVLLVAYAGAGALVVVAGHAALLTAGVIGDREGSEASLRDATRRADAGAGTGLAIVTALGALGVMAPVANAIGATARGASLWQDRALHDQSPASLFALAGLGLGAATALYAGSSLLESARRLGATAVIDTRAALLESGRPVHLAELDSLARRAVLAPLVVAVAMPLVVGFGLGAAALPAYLGGLVLTALVLAVWTGNADAALRSGLDVIETGRYGGRGSWGHSGALGAVVLTTGLRAAIGRLALPVALVSALLTAAAIGVFVTLPVDGTSVYLRWGIAVVGLGLMLLAHQLAASVPEPDLEDFTDDIDAPLFARAVDEREPDFVNAAWSDFVGEDDEADGRGAEVVVERPAKAKRGKGRTASAKAGSTKTGSSKAAARSQDAADGDDSEDSRDRD